MLNLDRFIYQPANDDEIAQIADGYEIYTCINGWEQGITYDGLYCEHYYSYRNNTKHGFAIIMARWSPINYIHKITEYFFDTKYHVEYEFNYQQHISFIREYASDILRGRCFGFDAQQTLEYFSISVDQYTKIYHLNLNNIIAIRDDMRHYLFDSDGQITHMTIVMRQSKNNAHTAYFKYKKYKRINGQLQCSDSAPTMLLGGIAL